MPNTPALGFPYPPGTGVAPDVPKWMRDLAVAIELKMPRGQLAYARRTAQAGPIQPQQSAIAIAGLSLTVTLATARKLKVTFMAQATSNVAGTIVGIGLQNRNTGELNVNTVQIPVANYGTPIPNMHVTSLPAGSYTFDVMHFNYSLPGFGGSYLTSDPAQHLIEDVGPA